jgi:hypothetical protein
MLAATTVDLQSAAELRNRLADVLNIHNSSIAINIFDTSSNTTQFYFTGPEAAQAVAELLAMTEKQRITLVGLEGLESLRAPNPLLRPPDSIANGVYASEIIVIVSVSLNAGLVFMAVAIGRITSTRASDILLTSFGAKGTTAPMRPPPVITTGTSALIERATQDRSDTFRHTPTLPRGELIDDIL